jgi:preprotein translocase subunit YajC
MLLLIQQNAAPGGQLTSFIVMVTLLFGIMWFLVIRPQRKRDRERREMLDALRKSDRVVTVGGIHGTVRSIRGEEVVLLVDESTNTKLRVSRSSIAQVLSETKEEGELSEPAEKE